MRRFGHHAITKPSQTIFSGPMCSEHALPGGPTNRLGHESRYKLPSGVRWKRSWLK
jgi:hypothetical protein